MEGIILSSRCGTYEVLLDDKTIITCKPRGLFRHKKIKLVVGDVILLDKDESIIKDVRERKNYLIRPNIANVDELAIVMSVKEPDFSSLLVDKFIAYASYFKIKASVILSKVDKVDNLDFINKKIDSLKSNNINVILYSKVTRLGVEEIVELFKGKTVALMGQSGVGKSSLLNVLFPNSKREEGEFSYALGRGKHMTKEVVLLPHEFGFVADTPGFSSLELPFFKEDLSKCFNGFDELSSNCKYRDCLHIHEQGCIIKERVNNGLYDLESYDNYLKILEELKHRKDRY